MNKRRFATAILIAFILIAFIFIKYNKESPLKIEPYQIIGSLVL